MKFGKSLVTGAVALAVLSSATPSHAVYTKVETFSVTFAEIDASNCAALSLFCREVFIQFGYDESTAIQKYASIFIYDWDFTGFLPVATLVGESRWLDPSYGVFIATNRKTAAFSGVVLIDSAPCDQFTGDCTGPQVQILVEAAAAVSASKGGAFKSSTVNVGPCSIKRTGTYSSRRGKTGTVSVGVDGYTAYNRNYSVYIEKDNLKITSKDCLGLPAARGAAIAQHLAGRGALVRQQVPTLRG